MGGEFCLECATVFSSQRAQSEVLWSIIVRYLSVCLSIREQLLKNLLLWNRPTDFNEMSQKLSLGDALSENFKDMNSMKNSGCYGNWKKKL